MGKASNEANDLSMRPDFISVLGMDSSFPRGPQASQKDWRGPAWAARKAPGCSFLLALPVSL